MERRPRRESLALWQVGMDAGCRQAEKLVLIKRREGVRGNEGGT